MARRKKVPYTAARPVPAAPEIGVSYSEDPLMKFGFAVDAAADQYGVALAAGYRPEVLNEKLSLPFLKYADTAGRLGNRIQFDRSAGFDAFLASRRKPNE